jgi:hypothetical protein
LVFTFLVQVRDGVGHEQERLEAVQIKPKAEISRDRDHDIAALNTPNEGNVEPSCLVTLFNSWWQGAQEAAELEAQRRAFSWRRALITLRNLSHKQFLAELDQWNEATRRSISGRPQLRQLTLFGQQDLPPAVRLRLKHHEERFKERQDALQRQMQFDEPKVEPIGVLLRVPAKALREEGV